MQAVPAGVESAGSRANRQPVVGPRGLPSLSAAVPTLLLSDFLPLLAETPQAQLRRAQAQFEAEKRDRRDRTDFREWLASAFQAPRFADVVGQAERRMLPGTLAARREELQAALREQTAGNRSGVSVTPIGASRLRPRSRPGLNLRCRRRRQPESARKRALEALRRVRGCRCRRLPPSLVSTYRRLSWRVCKPGRVGLGLGLDRPRLQRLEQCHPQAR